MRLAPILRTLGDKTRLRILRLLIKESLNVGELTQILGLAQPTVSKHLAALRRAGLVQVVKTARYSYYRLVTDKHEWVEGLLRDLAAEPDPQADLVRLEEILKQRQEMAESADRFVVPGRSWVAWSRALKYLLPSLRVADFGCGDGAFTIEIAQWAQRVYAIDSNASFLRLARERCNGTANIEFLHERMEELSLPGESVDLVVISQSLHYITAPLAALQEAHRILVEDGRILLLDLLPHQQEWVVDELHHQWMGFEPERLEQDLRKAGFRSIELDITSSHGPQPFRTVIASALKGASA